MAPSRRTSFAQILAQQRLASRNAEFAHAQRGRDPCEALDFLECQDLLARLELHAFLRHAVETTYVTAVRNADAQVVVDAVESVDQRGHNAISTLQPTFFQWGGAPAR